MTHDELLAKIEKQTVHIANKIRPVADECEKEIGGFANALRAVVELHKPVQGTSDISTYDYVGCDACVEWSHDGNMNLEYPCPTIQAIEKELA
jgi:hypothetical protein